MNKESKTKNFLINQIVNEAIVFISQSAHEYATKEDPLSFIGFETFYDGGFADLGVRFGLQSEYMKEKKKYGDEDRDCRQFTGNYKWYEGILDQENVKDYSNSLFELLKDEQGKSEYLDGVFEIFDDIIKRIIEQLRNKLHDVNVSHDLIIFNSGSYD